MIAGVSQKVLAVLGLISIGIGWQPVSSAAWASSALLPSPAQSDSGGGKLDRSQDRTVGDLIEELGSSSYAVRQSAVEQLWKLGATAQPALERAAASEDPEVARRAEQILSVLAMGIDQNTPSEIAKLVLQFHSSEQNVRTDVLSRLVADGMFQLVFDLLQQLKNEDDQHQLFNEVLDFDDTLIGLARAHRWDDFEFVLGHPLTFKHRTSAAVHYRLVNGSLADLVRQLRTEINTAESDGRSVNTRQLFRLIGIFRLQGDYQQALNYAEKIPDSNVRAAIIPQILMERGDWQAIAQKMTSPDVDALPTDGEIVVTPVQRALVNRFVGNQAGYDDTVNELLRKAESFKKELDQPGERAIRDTLVEIGLSNLDWPLVESNLNPEDEYKSFRLYVLNNRTEQAFELVGLGHDVEQRDIWFNRRVRTMQSLESKSKRLKQNGLDNDETITRLSQTFENSFQVAGLLGGLGLTDESAMHFQTLFAALEGDEQKYRRFNVIQELIELERYDVVWKMIESGFDPSDYHQLVNYIFANRASTSRFWYDRIKTRHPEPLERLKVTSGILNSPLGTVPGFDLQFELASAFSNPASVPNIEYYLAKIYEFHGDEEASRQQMALARELGLDVARRTYALEQLEDGNYESAIELLDNTWETRQSGFEVTLAADAYRQTGDPRNAMLRECLAYAMWRDTYRNTGTISSLELIGQSHLIRDLLKLEVIHLDGPSISSERYRSQLAVAQFQLEPTQSAVNQQLALFNAASGGAGTLPLGYWSESRKQLNMALAKSRIDRGEFDDALQLLLQYNEFCPGDPEVGEKFIRNFDQAGATEQADLLFEKLTEPYFEILERYPDSSFHHNNYAWICACANRRTEHMLRHSLKACSERPNSSTFNDTLAEIYYLLGDTESAIKLSQRCLEINPTKQHYRQQLKRFRAGLK